MIKGTKVIVTFRNADDELTCLMNETFKSVEDAKAAIELDGDVFLNAHNLFYKRGKKISREVAEWVYPDNEDYYRVVAHDGSKCIYQYFIQHI